MVTKLSHVLELLTLGLILAKNHMVTKLWLKPLTEIGSLILAKNHMVTKLTHVLELLTLGLILVKNHMVTKPQIHVTIYLKIIKYWIFYRVIDISSLAFILFIIISFASCSGHTPLFK